MNINSHEGTVKDVCRKEEELLRQGYRITNYSNPKNLLPGEYIKTVSTGTANSFEGRGGALLRWCPLP